MLSTKPGAGQSEALATLLLPHELRDHPDAVPLQRRGAKIAFQAKVGDRGLRLSGGQRQRIAIARAFLKKAPILLLDEATSSLDSESEEAIREALQRLMQSKTVLAIAHRLSTLRSFDRIVVLHSGRIVQDGSPDALIRSEGIYRGLVMREMSRLRQEAI
jgi:ATP-binding cassette subfamily B protein